jgi:hypothetical protein
MVKQHVRAHPAFGGADEVNERGTNRQNATQAWSALARERSANERNHFVHEHVFACTNTLSRVNDASANEESTSCTNCART